MAIINSSFPPVTYTYAGSSGTGGLVYTTVTPSTVAINQPFRFGPSRISESFAFKKTKDFSNSNLSVYAEGNADISANESKFGAASAYFNGSVGAVVKAENVPAIGSGNFTIEFWMNLNLIQSGSRMLFDMRPQEGAYPTIYLSFGSLTYYSTSANRISTVIIPTLNTWQHLAVVRNSGTTTMYLDGLSLGSFPDTTNYLAGPMATIGNYSTNTNSTSVDAYIDEFRITSNIARYVSNFTPPSAAFGNNVAEDPEFNNVTLLLHMESMQNEKDRAIDFLGRTRGVMPSHRRTGRVIQSLN